MTQTTLEIRWWIFEEISNRAGKYNWALDCKAGEETTYSYKSMFVNGNIVGESEKAFKVELDYIKLYDKERTVYNGFTAWIPKKAILSREDVDNGEEEDVAVVDNMYCDYTGYCLGAKCPMFYQCHG